MNEKLFDYIANSPTAYHACASTAKILSDNGYTELKENSKWSIEDGRGYFVQRNGSSLIAFRVPRGGFRGFAIAASHSDSPCFKIKENSEISDSNYVRLSVEKYGGMLCSTWLDRPLSIAGRAAVRSQDGIKMRLFDLKEPCAIIPNVAIHMNRNANENMSYNVAVDMIPLFGTAACRGGLKRAISDALGVSHNDIISLDTFLYNCERGVRIGDLISAPRLDDLQCSFSSLEAFISSESSTSNVLPVYALFDNEEVGSQTKQGAASTFLCDVLQRTVYALGGDREAYFELVANSFMASCDNAHAIHPNHPEYSDKNHFAVMNGGIVIKYNANQRYTSDAVSAAMFKAICEKVGVPTQTYANRADMAGGSTLGNIANTQVSLNTVDIGLAQLAMHSSYETAGADDTEYMVKALSAMYSSRLNIDGCDFNLT